MRILITGIILALFAKTSFSQEYPRIPGNLSQEEINLKFYAKDTEAPALVLYDLGESEFFESENGYDIRFTRKKRIKIFSKAGIEYSEITLPFYSESFVKTEKVNIVNAVTYNYENDKIVARPLDKSTIYEVILNERWKAKKFTFPNVREGSIIEYEYVLETPFHFNLPDWTFQDRIPTHYSEYVVKSIPFYDYCFIAQNISKFDHQSSKISPEERTYGSVNMLHGKNFGTGFKFRDVIHTFVKKDVPAFYDEAYISSADDYLMKIDFQLERFNKPSGGSEEIITTWPKMVTFLLKYEKFGKHINDARKPAKKILKSIPGLESLSDQEKCITLINYVKSNISWNGRNDKYASKSLKEFLAQKTGTSADINLFLIALLKEAGIKAEPVIISTRNHGKIIVDYPFHHFFNYVIVLVDIDGTVFLTDATDNLLAYNRIPLKCINDKGLLIDKKEVSWVTLNSNMLSLDKKDIKLTVNPDDYTLNAQISIQATEYDTYKYKQSFNNDTVKICEKFQNSGLSKVSDIQTFNYDKSTLPYVINMNAELDANVIQDKIIVYPFLNFPEKENKLKLPARTYPVDLIYARKEEYKSMIFVPEGYKAGTIPANTGVDNDMVEINVKYTNNDTFIEANGYYVLKKPVYNTDEYTRLRRYFDMIVTKLNEEIVLVKHDESVSQ